MASLDAPLHSVGDLQATIRSLVYERRQLRDRLNRWPARNMMNDGNPRRYKRGRMELEGPQIEEVPEKRFQAVAPPILSKSASSALDVPITAFPVEKRPSLQLDDSTVKRNRNLFGSLVGHLKKAKTVLEQEKTTKAAELHRTMEEHVSQKLDFERKNLAELRRRDYQERQQKDLSRIREVQTELRMKENEMLSVCLQQHFNRMKSFIRTDTAPLIFWIPSLHNDKTKQLQDDTREQIDRKLKSIVEKFAAENEKVRTSLAHALKAIEDNDANMESSEHDKPEAATVAAESAAAASLEVIRGVHPDLINDSDDSDDSDDEQQNAIQDREATEHSVKTTSATTDGQQQQLHFGQQLGQELGQELGQSSSPKSKEETSLDAAAVGASVDREMTDIETRERPEDTDDNGDGKN